MTEIQPKNRKRGRPRSASFELDSKPVKALERGLLILQSIGELNSATLSELAAQNDIPPATVHRILMTLQAHGFVNFDTGTQEWAIGIGSFRIGSNYLARSNLFDSSLIVMRELTANTGETSNLGIAEAGRIVFVTQVETTNPIRAMFRQGTGSPMHASGIGKALLANMEPADVAKLVQKNGQPAFTEHTLTTLPALMANLKTISNCGWSIDNEERYLGMRCVAAAVYNAYGQIVAGLSISAPSARLSDSALKKTGPIVRAAADKLSVMIGGKPRIDH